MKQKTSKRNISKRSGGNFCEKRLIYWGQFKDPICWFISILVSTFYSQGLRKKLFKASRKTERWKATEDKKNKVFKIFRHILDHKYLKSNDPFKDMSMLEKYSPRNILKLIHTHNKDYYLNFDDYSLNQGYQSVLYIKYFYDLLGIDSVMIDVYYDNKVTYSLYNTINYIDYDNEKNIINYQYNMDIATKNFVIKELNREPDVLIVAIRNNLLQNELRMFNNVEENMLKHYDVPDKNKEDILGYGDEITYNGIQYKLDAIILSNFNKNAVKCGHVVAGITCKGEKYLFNGYTYEKIYNKDMESVKAPCKLQLYDWNAQKTAKRKYFCLNAYKCGIIDETDSSFGKKSNLCFSFGIGNRILLYVRADKPNEVLSSYKTCNEDTEVAAYKSFENEHGNILASLPPTPPDDQLNNYCEMQASLPQESSSDGSMQSSSYQESSSMQSSSSQESSSDGSMQASYQNGQLRKRKIRNSNSPEVKNGRQKQTGGKQHKIQPKAKTTSLQTKLSSQIKVKKDTQFGHTRQIQIAKKNARQAQDAKKNTRQAQDAKKNMRQTQVAKKNTRQTQDAKKNTRQAQDAKKNTRQTQDAKKNARQPQDAKKKLLGSN